MSLYKKIDTYLLQNYPNIWITRVHIFIPLAIIIIAILFLFNVYVIGYNPSSEFSDQSSPILLMLIPILIYLVYWFVMQARFNVEKSGGKLSLIQDYLNYFIYFLVFSMAYAMVITIPASSNFKAAQSLSNIELKKEINALDLGYVLVEKPGSINQIGGSYSFTPQNNPNNFYEYSYYNSYNDDYDQINVEFAIKTVSKSELIKIIENYITIYTKYDSKIRFKSAEDIIRNNILMIEDNNLLEYSYSSYGNEPYQKLTVIKDFKNKSWVNEFINNDILLIMSILISFLALFVWIFKQIHWKNYMFGIISLALTPLLIGLIGVTLYEVLRLSDDDLIPVFFIFGYIFVAFIVFRGILKPEKDKLTIVASMYLQLLLPFIVLNIWIIYDSRLNLGDDWQTFFILSWGIGLSSIGIFKYIYKHLELKPSKK